MEEAGGSVQTIWIMNMSAVDSCWDQQDECLEIRHVFLTHLPNFESNMKLQVVF